MRTKRESPPPGWYGRSSSGRYFRICRTSHRHEKTGEKCYRLEYHDPLLKGNGLFTLKQLEEAGVKFLQNRPTCFKKTPADAT